MKFFILFLLLPLNAWSLTGKKEIQFLEKKVCRRLQNIPSTIFSKTFLHEPGLEAAQDVFSSLYERFGECKSVKEGAEGVNFFFSEAKVPLRFRWGNDKIDSFEIGSAKFPNDSLKKIEKRLEKMQGEYSFYSEKEGKKNFSFQENRKLPVGRSGEVYLLSLLEGLAQDKKIKYSDSIAIREEDRSESSGILVDWPVGTFASIDSLRYFMVVQNDSMAADILFRFIGKKTLQSLAKNPVTNKEYERVMQLPMKDFFKYVPEAKAEFKETKQSWKKTKYLGWQFTNKEMCQKVLSLKSDSIFSVASSPIEPENSSKVLYTGNWQEGLSHGTVAWQTKGGSWSCVSLSLNGPEPMDVETFHEVLQRLVDLSQ